MLSLQAEGWSHGAVPASVGSRPGCRGACRAAWAVRDPCRSIQAVPTRCCYKAVLCRIDLGSDVMVRSRGDESTDVELLLLPTGRVNGELLGVGEQGV